jgi:hypothetical protein
MARELSMFVPLITLILRRRCCTHEGFGRSKYSFRFLGWSEIDSGIAVYKPLAGEVLDPWRKRPPDKPPPDKPRPGGFLMRSVRLLATEGSLALIAEKESKVVRQ